jgi:hypothetical protein
MVLHVYRWRGLSFLSAPGRVPEVGVFEAVEDLTAEEYEAWREMLIDAILDDAGRNWER